jgi:hypothetical protein
MTHLERVVGGAAKGIIVALVITGLALAAILLTLNYGFGIGVTRRAPQEGLKNMRTIQRPSATVRVVSTTSSDLGSAAVVSIAKLSDIYASIGVTNEDFEWWEKEHGMDSLGVTPDGKPFVSEYRVLSKVAWMYIDPVTLTRAEIVVLMEEIARAETHAVNDQVA